ncbi:putative membrane protein [Ureibacillus acetophenoni]|uniref:Putative membrane protein n=2 Tax=Ureibacillus acetophenoni TaxID=614649 RepID=A0A285UJW4_9BACL|nr:putative membrane protein [Ureibacillus acetophenoni]
MMSKEIYKLHPISAVINFVKGLKELIIPIGIIFLSRFLNRSEELNFWTDLLPILIIGVPVIFYLFSGIIKWWTFIYWFEEDELRVEYGLFIKKKRYIPFERIQSLNYKEGIFHQIFGLVQVMVETAGSTDGKPEVELTAVKKDEAKRIEVQMYKSKNQKSNLDYLGNAKEGEFISEPLSESIHKMSNKDLLILATTSNSIGVVLAGIAAVVGQFSEYIPYDLIFEELSLFVQFGVVIILFTIIVGLLLAWLLSIGLTFLSYYDFSVMKESDKVIVTRGLLEKKKVTIPLNRIQAIKIVENPLRQLFGFASVIIESAGGAAGEKEKKMTLFPLIKKKQLIPILNDLFPNFELEVDIVRPPKKAKTFFYRMDFIWLIPVIALCMYFYYPYGLLSMLLIIPVILLGIWRFKTAGLAIRNNQLMIVYRRISRITFLVEKKRIQVVMRKQSFFQKRKKLASIQATVMSGITGATAIASHLDEVETNTVLDWIEHKRLS